jgi:hypothetical protein
VLLRDAKRFHPAATKFIVISDNGPSYRGKLYATRRR